MRTNSNGSAPPVTSFPTPQATGPSANTTMAGTSDADLLLNLHSPYIPNSNTGSSPAFPQQPRQQQPQNFTSNDPHQNSFNQMANANWNYANMWNPLDFSQGQNGMQPLFGDMMIESQDVDMSMLGLDMMPWFDNFSGGDMMFGDGRQAGAGAAPEGASQG